ncbi:MAG TPA: hypothetical protein VHI98_10075 [Vicinamibacterales bacterium]|nr:hypothetical protein [Vicinamibacterales bacterium]
MTRETRQVSSRRKPPRHVEAGRKNMQLTPTMRAFWDGFTFVQD